MVESCFSAEPIKKHWVTTLFIESIANQQANKQAALIIAGRKQASRDWASKQTNKQRWQCQTSKQNTCVLGVSESMASPWEELSWSLCWDFRAVGPAAIIGTITKTTLAGACAGTFKLQCGFCRRWPSDTVPLGDSVRICQRC
ncbi:unnamed protein product [Polarella glacialis]|uniref:Uncharacterized protein n=1 Tax=Polarella glacialis TaxID=89957 RepID=A0A813EE33_POLGL|nr:unnamed protein product [Polarella glacialis]